MTQDIVEQVANTPVMLPDRAAIVGEVQFVEFQRLISSYGRTSKDIILERSNSYYSYFRSQTTASLLTRSQLPFDPHSADVGWIFFTSCENWEPKNFWVEPMRF